MTGILGLPPGLRGYAAAQQEGDADQIRQLQMVQGLLGLQGAARENELFPLKRDQLQLAVDRARANNELFQGVSGAIGGRPGMLGTQPSGVQPTAQAGDTGAAPGMPPQSGGLLNAPPLIQAMLLSGDSGMENFAKAHMEQNKPIAAREGAPVINGNTGEVKFFAPKLEPGMVPQYNGSQLTGVSNAPGYIDSMTERNRAQERVRAGFDLVTVPPTSPNAPPTFQSRGQVLQGAGAIPSDSLVRETAPNRQSAIARGMQLGASGQPYSISVPPPIPTSSVVGNAAGMSPLQQSQVKLIDSAQSEAGQLDAKAANAFRDSIPKVQTVLRRLDRLEQLSADGTFASAGAEIKTQLGSIAQGLGLSIDKEKTANSETYLAQVAELLKDRLSSKDYGSGTGISNIDLLSAKVPLPDLVRTPQGRVQIINAIRQDSVRSLADMQAGRDFFDRNRSLQGFRYPSEIASQVQTAKPEPQRRATDRKVINFSDWK